MVMVMDAKKRAKFINSISDTSNHVANGKSHKRDDENQRTAPKVDSNNDKAQQTEFVSDPVETEEDDEIFAQGLPSWNLEPPQVAVRRARKK